MRDRFLDDVRRVGESRDSKSRSGERRLDYHALESIGRSRRYRDGD